MLQTLWKSDLIVFIVCTGQRGLEPYKMRWKISQFAIGMRNAFKEIDVLGGAHNGLENIRNGMLDCMRHVAATQAPQGSLWRAISNAKDAQTLWYLRSDLMSFLCAQKGEPYAKAQLEAITKSFRGQVPNAQFASAMRPRHF